ncbi:AMP-binding protein [Parapusillimonas granuli]|uniref:AMP-binding protein n=1 Tax=Parapusillimonas granuli TaxID=380911 RepID=A0A853FVW5_9BURK|nr:AMP-binding protein [Parapusillimonas granuli]MBB5214644.1 acyl-CoA synthetase (AMP-forming)/AMP-acid ligase II [Parapusillimonas granuli]MEB2398108.1 AMP-binding protein [Alcaligenaceae bacterium]NYT48948.1 AMP-binding protein [Parapusillimonas granuli]
MNQGRFISRAARYWADKPAIIFGQHRISFQALEARSNRLANALLGMGLNTGDRVAIQAWNRPEIIELECALYKAGLVRVGLNARLSSAELCDTVNNAEARILLVDESHRDAAMALAQDMPSLEAILSIGGGFGRESEYEALLGKASDAPVDRDMRADDLAVLHFTSGSTGKLKAAMQTVGNRLASLRKVAMGRMRADPGEVLALAGPITHASGMFMQPFLFQGGTILLHERFEPDAFLASIQEHRAAFTFMVPTMVNMVVALPSLRKYDLGSLRQLSYGGAPMAPARVREAWHALGPILCQGYGAGETTGGMIMLTSQDHRAAIEGRPERLMSCGRAFGETEVVLRDDEGRPVPPGEVGEITVRGPDVFAGYWREPELSKQALRAGWCHTGDLARMDDEGYIYIVDRKKDMIISGGFNVYPTEVEQALYQHPAVYEACVFGIPDEIWGESVKAAVVLKPGAQADEAGLAAHCKALLADFKKPRSIDILGELPKNANGKISRKALKDPYWAGHERMVV